MSRYESLLNRAQAATKAVDELDLLRLQRAKVDNGTGSNSSIATTNTSNTSSNTTPNASIAADNNDNFVGKYLPYRLFLNPWELGSIFQNGFLTSDC